MERTSAAARAASSASAVAGRLSVIVEGRGAVEGFLLVAEGGVVLRSAEVAAGLGSDLMGERPILWV